MKLFIDPEDLQARYAASPDWLQRLMDRLGRRRSISTSPPIPQVRPRVIPRFEPWMALSFTEGSIGGDIERISLHGARGLLRRVAAGRRRWPPSAAARARADAARTAFAIAPANTTDGHALLLINPHTSFFFRSELQMTSEEGLNAYGAATWGQFFIYQGFNDRAGWMHTSSGVDVVDEFSRRSSSATAASSTATATRSGRSTTSTVTVPLSRRRRQHGRAPLRRSTAPITARSSARQAAAGSHSR